MSDAQNTAIVTGASQGIGAGIVKGFVERGLRATNSFSIKEFTRSIISSI